MEELEQQVWQRVLGERQPQQQTDLKALALDTVEAAEEYRQLLSRRPGRERELLKKLLEGEQANLACLKGLYSLQTGTQMKLLSFPAAGSPGRKQLVKRYHLARRALAEYTARSAESEWGCVFHAMAQRQETQCAMLAQLLGHMD